MTQVTAIAEPTVPHVAGRIGPQGRRSKDSAPADPSAARGRGLDQVELSETARRAGVAGAVGDMSVRTELVERVRREIAEGTYETDEKLDVTVERLLRVLDSAQG